MPKKEKFIENQFTWPICKKLLFLILEDKVSDVFVCELVWERLFYTLIEPYQNQREIRHNLLFILRCILNNLIRSTNTQSN